MRKWLALSAALFIAGLSCFAQAQAPNVRAVIFPPIAASGFTPSCSQSSAWLARATGVTLIADKTNYDNLICGLVTDGVFAKLDALYIYTAVDHTTSLLNLVQNSFNQTETATITFTQYVGSTGNGTTGFESTNLTPSTGGTNYVQNSASFGVCVLTSSAIDHGIQMGGGSTVNSFLWVRAGNGNLTYSVNGGLQGAPIIANSQGFWLVNRSSSAAIQAYKNGASIDSTASTSGGLNAVPIDIFARNDNPATSFDDMQYGAAFIGGSLSATDAGNFHTRLNTYLTAYSQGSKC